MDKRTRGEKVFFIFDYAITVVKVSVVSLGIMLVVIGVSGVELDQLDEHEIFRYRTHAVVAVVAFYLLASHLFARRRARLAALAESTASDSRQASSYVAALIALAFVAAGTLAFWHDHNTHEIPNPVAVEGAFITAKCVASSTSRGRSTIGSHMLISYDFPSQSIRPRVSGMQCLLDKCEEETAPPAYRDTAAKQVFYQTFPQCQAALPSVLQLKAPTTVWTADKDAHPHVRARFTPERDPPPYFLLWVPMLVGAVLLLVLLVSGLRRRWASRRAR